MLYSLTRALKCRQVGQVQINLSVNGTAVTPVASGPDAAYVSSVTDLGTGSYKINLKEIQKLNVHPSSLISLTAGASLSVSAVDTSSVTVAAVSQAPVKASLVVQDITYTARVGGTAGNSITIEYANTATAGAETVTVTGTAIVVGIQSGVSTATQVAAALAASVQAQILISDVITGTAGTAQVTAAAAPLAGGADTAAADADFSIQLQLATELGQYF